MSRVVTRNVDGLHVDNNKARVSGQFLVDEVDAGQLATDDEKLGLLFFRVDAPTFRQNKAMDLERIDVLKPLEFRVILDDEDAAHLMEKYGFYVPAPQGSPIFADNAADGEKTDPDFMAEPEPEPEVEPEVAAQAKEDEAEAEEDWTNLDEPWPQAEEDEDAFFEAYIAGQKPEEVEDVDPRVASFIEDGARYREAANEKETDEPT